MCETVRNAQLLATWFLWFIFSGLIAVTGVLAECDCTQEVEQQGVSPVCGDDGLTYLHKCLAACQGVDFQPGECNDDDVTPRTSAGGPAPARAATEFFRNARMPPGVRLNEKTMAAYADENLKCIGFANPTTFKPIMPVISRREAMQLNQRKMKRGTTMMLDSNGILYAAAPGSTITGPGAAIQLETHVADDTGALDIAMNAASTDASAVAPATVAGRRMLMAHTAAAVADAEMETADDSAGRQLRAVFGPDTRKQIRRLPQMPYSATGHLIFTSRNVRYQCTGSLIGKFTVLTAAHCLVNRKGDMQQNIEFIPGQTINNATGLGVGKGVRIFFNKRYLGDSWTQWDCGLLVLDRPFGVDSALKYNQELIQMVEVVNQAASNGSVNETLDMTKVLAQLALPAWPPSSYKYAIEPPLKRTRVISAGYPGDKPYGSYWKLNCLLDENDPSAPVLINYCPTSPGQSGAPLIDVQALKSRKLYMVRALITFEMCETVCYDVCCNNTVLYNGALRITDFFKEFIDKHKNAKPYKLPKPRNETAG